MEKVIIHTYQQIVKDSRLFELAKESGMVYSRTLKAFWKRYNKENVWMTEYDLQSYMKDKLKRNLLHSDSYLGSLQLVADNLSSWRSAKKEWEKHPEKFSGKPIPPHRRRFFQVIVFKKSAIRLKNGYLFLSLAKGNDPIKIKWTLDKPKYCTINYDRTKGWLLNTTLEVPAEQLDLNKENILAIDLGVNRIATTFNSTNNEVVTYSGKYIKSLIRLENKIRNETQKKLSKTKFKSRRNNVLRRANRVLRKKIKGISSCAAGILYGIDAPAIGENVIVCAGSADKRIISRCTDKVLQQIAVSLHWQRRGLDYTGAVFHCPVAAL